MRKTCVLALVVAFALVMSGIAMAGNTATQTVTFQVSAIDQLSVSGDPAALTISTATAGSEPDEVSDTSTTYAVTTNETSKKITAAIDSDMPSGVTLKIALAAPAGGTSAGDVSLSSTAADVVTAIGEVAEGSLGITYKLDATVAAGVVSSDTRTVTLTLTDGVG